MGQMFCKNGLSVAPVGAEGLSIRTAEAPPQTRSAQQVVRLADRITWLLRLTRVSVPQQRVETACAGTQAPPSHGRQQQHMQA